jgi:hypothetical protein
MTPRPGVMARADESAIEHIANARQILAGIEADIPAKYLTYDSRVSSLVSCAALVQLRERLLFALAKLAPPVRSPPRRSPGELGARESVPEIARRRVAEQLEHENRVQQADGAR